MTKVLFGLLFSGRNSGKDIEVFVYYQLGQLIDKQQFSRYHEKIDYVRLIMGYKIFNHKGFNNFILFQRYFKPHPLGTSCFLCKVRPIR